MTGATESPGAGRPVTPDATGTAGTPSRTESRCKLVLLLVLLVGLVAAWFPFQSRPDSELPVYVLGASRLLQGEPIYRTSDTKPFTYPPFFAVPFVPFTKLAEGWQRPAWFVMNAASLALLLWMVARAGEPRGTGGMLFFWGGIVVLAGRHIASVFENQSHDLLVAAAVALGADAWRRSRDAQAGACFGLGAACKATPLLYLVPLVMQRRVRGVTALALAAVGLTLLPDLAYPGPRSWVVTWFETFLKGLSVGGTAAAEGAWTPGSFLNQSLSGTLHRLLATDPTDSRFVVDVAVVNLPDLPRRLVTIVAQLAIVAGLALFARRRPVRDEDAGSRNFGIAAATVCGMVLLSPMSSKSHFCVLALPAAFCLSVLRGRRDAVLVLLLALEAGLGVLTVKGLLGVTLGNTLLAYGSVTWSALCAFLASGRALALLAREGP